MLEPKGLLEAYLLRELVVTLQRWKQGDTAVEGRARLGPRILILPSVPVRLTHTSSLCSSFLLSAVLMSAIKC